MLILTLRHGIGGQRVNAKVTGICAGPVPGLPRREMMRP